MMNEIQLLPTHFQQLNRIGPGRHLQRFGEDVSGLHVSIDLFNLCQLKLAANVVNKIDTALLSFSKMPESGTVSSIDNIDCTLIILMYL